MKRPDTVDGYIAEAPEKLRAKLRSMRETIRKAAPEALEKISYGMPYYGYKGRLAYFAYAKNHIGLYIPPPVIEQHKEELKDYVTSISAVRFPSDRELPLPLIRKLVAARVKWNEKNKK